MSAVLQKHPFLISALLLLSILVVSLYLPAAAPALGIFCILFAFTTGVAFIIEKHKGHELARRKIARDILILTITLLLTILLGVWVSGSGYRDWWGTWLKSAGQGGEASPRLSSPFSQVSQLGIWSIRQRGK